MDGHVECVGLRETADNGRPRASMCTHAGHGWTVAWSPNVRIVDASGGRIV